MKHRYAGALVALIFATGSIAGVAQQAAYQQAVLPADTVLRVRLNDPLGSDRSRPGDRFSATVEDPTLPDGTLIRGVVTRVQPAVSGVPGKIAFDFRSLELPSGQRIPIEATPIGLDSRSVRTTPSGRMVATSHGKTNTGAYAGYGAAGGLAIGSLIGKNVVGGLLGAGAGYLLGKHHAKKDERRDVVLKDGAEMGVRLDEPITVAAR